MLCRFFFVSLNLFSPITSFLQSVTSDFWNYYLSVADQFLCLQFSLFTLFLTYNRVSCPLISVPRTDFRVPTQKPKSSAPSIGSDVTWKIVIVWMVPIYHASDLCSLAEHPLLKGGQQRKPQVQHNNKANNDSHLPSGFSTQSPATSTVVTTSARGYTWASFLQMGLLAMNQLSTTVVAFLWWDVSRWIFFFLIIFFFCGSTFCLEYDRSYIWGLVCV